jgi:hypothetical protein
MGAVAYAKYKNGLSATMLTTGCGATNAITGLLYLVQQEMMQQYLLLFVSFDTSIF